MTSKNNRAPLLCRFKFCTSFCNHCLYAVIFRKQTIFIMVDLTLLGRSKIWILAFVYAPMWSFITNIAALIRHFMSRIYPWIVCYYFDGLAQDCSNPIANALELLQYCTKPSICSRYSVMSPQYGWTSGTSMGSTALNKLLNIKEWRQDLFSNCHQGEMRYQSTL